MFTFVVASARPGRDLPGHLDEALDLIEQRDLPFTPAHRLRWRSADGRVLVAAWEPPDQLGTGRRWEVRPSGVTLLGGLTWLDGQPWSREVPFVAQLADALTTRPIEQRVDDLCGEFTVVSLGPDGTGTVTADPLGMSMLVRGSGDDLVVASNLPAGAARLLVRPGLRPPRDPDAAAWLVYGSYLQENRTGFTCVSRVPEGAHLVTGPDRPLDVVVRNRWPWWDGVRAADADVGEVVSSAAAHLTRNLVLAASLPSRRRAFELTGGHDSRLVLALAIRAGVQHEFSYLTWGEPGLPDVDVALALASRFELDHLRDPRPGHRPVPAPGPREPEAAPRDPATAPLGLAASIRHHVWATSGMQSALDRVRPQGHGSSSVSTCGIFGEVHRSVFVAAGGLTDQQLPGLVRRGALHGDPAELLHRDVRQDLDRRVVEQIRDSRVGAGTVRDALDGYYQRRRLRAWFGSLTVHDWRNRVYPLLCPASIRAAFSLGDQRRVDELLFFETIRGASDDLAREPFAGGGWPAALVADLDDSTGYPVAPTPPPWTRTYAPVRHRAAQIRRAARNRRHAPGVAEGGVVSLNAGQEIERNAAEMERLVDLPAGHPLRDLVDPAAVRRLLDRTNRDFYLQRALLDLATAAVWLGEGESRAAVSGPAEA